MEGEGLLVTIAECIHCCVVLTEDGCVSSFFCVGRDDIVPGCLVGLVRELLCTSNHISQHAHVVPAILLPREPECSIHHPELAEVGLARICIPFLNDLHAAGKSGILVELTADLDEISFVHDSIVGAGSGQGNKEELRRVAVILFRPWSLSSPQLKGLGHNICGDSDHSAILVFALELAKLQESFI